MEKLISVCWAQVGLRAKFDNTRSNIYSRPCNVFIDWMLYELCLNQVQWKKDEMFEFKCVIETGALCETLILDFT